MPSMGTEMKDTASVASASSARNEAIKDIKMSAEKIKSLQAEERSRIIVRLTRLNAKPDFPQIQFRYDDSLETLRRLNKVASMAGRQKMSIDFMKRMTVFCARLAEMLCEKFPNKFIDLKGYSQYLFLTINEYDNLLADVYDFYAETFAEASPLSAYFVAIGSNAVMYSISRKLVNNPVLDAMKNMAQGVMGDAAKRFPMPGMSSGPPPDQSARRRERINEILRNERRKGASGGGGFTGPDMSDDDVKSTVSFETLNTAGAPPSSAPRVPTTPTPSPVGPPRSSTVSMVEEEKHAPKPSPPESEEPRRKKIRFNF